MIKGLTYAIVTTKDIQRARDFYTRQLGLTTEEDDDAMKFSQFTTRDGTLWGIMQEPDAAATGGNLLYLLVEDADEAYRVWRERGVETVSEPHNAPFGRTFAFRDCDGRILHAYAAA